MPGYVTLTNRATGKDELIDADQALTAISSGAYLDPGAVAVHRDGMATYATPDVAAREQTFAPVIDPAIAAREQGHLLRERENTGAAATAKAVVGGGVNSASFGLFDPFADAQEFNPIASGVGQVVGAIAPAFAGDLGGLVGLGRGAAVADDALTAERAASAISSKALLSGERGAGELERGLARGNAALAAGTDAAQGADAAATAGLAGLDAKGLRAAHEAEVERLAQEQVAQRAAAKSGAVDDVVAYRATVKDSNPWLVIDEGAPSKQLNKANNSLRAALDDPKGLREAPGTLLKPLRIEEQALQGAIEKRAAIAAKLDEVNARIADNLGEDLATLPDAATHVELTGKAARRYAAYADIKVAKGASVSVAREDAQGFLDALTNGKVQGDSREALNKLDGLLEQNRALQGQLKAAVAPLVPKAELTSARVKAIADAKDLLSAGGAAAVAPKSMAEQMLGGTIFSGVAGLASAIPGVGHMLAPLAGAKASKLVTDLVFGKLGTATAAAGAKATDIASQFATVGGKILKSPALLASKVLADAAFAPRREAPAGAPPAAPGKKPAAAAAPAKGDLPGQYQRVTDELRSLTMLDPASGAIVMRPDARATMARQFDAIRAVSPLLADRMESVAARKVEFLSSIIPKLPDYGTPQIGPDRRRTPDLLQRSFARSVAAVEDPHAAMGRIVSGRFVTEDANALRAVYPEMVADLVHQIVPQLATLQRTLPYARRLALSMLTGQAVDPAMTPAVLREIQSMYAAEPGTAGGTQAPTPQPQFGSVKRSDPGTPAQRRQGLT